MASNKVEKYLKVGQLKLIVIKVYPFSLFKATVKTGKCVM